MKTNSYYIQRCLELAKLGLGTTYPNPMVGCVIVYKNQIIGEGWHQKAGEAHAEVLAIQSVKDQSLLKFSTLYVTLEPCSHYGKTPPCSDLIIEKKIPKIVIGTIDPFAKVAGMGIKKLLAANRQVIVGVCEQDCEKLNRRFFTFHRKKRPYILLKWAETTHGFIAPDDQKQNDIFWITNPYSRQLVHKWRAEEASILVGTQTAKMDNPQLNVRHWHGNNPTRLVLDKTLSLNPNSRLLDGYQPTLVFYDKSKQAAWSGQATFIGIDFSKNVLLQLLDNLHKRDLQSVIVEGGAKTLQSFIDLNLWDEARVFMGQNKIENGLKAPKLKKKASKTLDIEGDKLNYYYND